MHITAGIFGDQSVSQELSKKLAKTGTANDIAIYNHASSEGVFTYVCPNSEKLQSLLQTIWMIDFPIIIFQEFTKEFGEQVVAIDAAGFEKGFLVDAGMGEEKIKQIIKGSSLEKFPILSNDPTAIRQEIIQCDVKRDTTSQPWLPIDNYFNVKSVGTVALSIVKTGKIKKYDNLRIEPIGKDVMIKGLQSQDNDITEAEAGMRLGVNLKGVDADELKRGYVICKEAKVSKLIRVKFTKSRYSRETLTVGCKQFCPKSVQAVMSAFHQIILVIGSGENYNGHKSEIRFAVA